MKNQLGFKEIVSETDGQTEPEDLEIPALQTPETAHRYTGLASQPEQQGLAAQVPQTAQQNTDRLGMRKDQLPHQKAGHVI